MRRSLLVAALLLAGVVSVPAAQPASRAATKKPRIVGRWQRVRTCQELVDALTKYGLKQAAPAAVGDFFPDATPQQLAEKSDICAGAKPQKHSHFFTRSREFGSLDQYGARVDDGHYRLLGRGRIRINAGTFRYRISGGRLTLVPLITDAQRSAALADPVSFSTATWMVAVAYPGHSWARVRCGRWCRRR